MAEAIRVFVPSDTTARSVGADAVAAAIEALAARRGVELAIIRNGSRGLYWLEPLIEVEVAGRRVAYGPVVADDVAGLFDAGFEAGGAHAKLLGPTDSIPYLAAQDRLTFARVGLIDPASLDDYRAHEGYRGLEAALAMSGQAMVDSVKESGLRGRGGAGFPTGIKWQTVLDTPAEQKFVVCNADEGDSGTYADRMIMESDPFVLIEGMTIAGLAVGATRGYIYLRAEYPQAIRTMNAAVAAAGQAGYLGESVCGSGRAFHVEVREAAGAYICGEETSLLESLEGKRGVVRYRPPLPAVKGLFGAPTIVNNVITLSTVPTIFARGASFYQDFGTGRSRGTLTVQLAGNIKQGGLVDTQDNESIERNPSGELYKRAFDIFQIPIAIQMIGLKGRKNGYCRCNRKKRPVVFIRLHNNVVSVTEPGVGSAKATEFPTHDDRGVEPSFHEHQTDHRSGCGLSACAGYSDAVLEPHYLCKHFRASDDRNFSALSFQKFGILRLDSR